MRRASVGTEGSGAIAAGVAVDAVEEHPAARVLASRHVGEHPQCGGVLGDDGDNDDSVAVHAGVAIGRAPTLDPRFGDRLVAERPAAIRHETIASAHEGVMSATHLSRDRPHGQPEGPIGVSALGTQEFEGEADGGGWIRNLRELESIRRVCWCCRTESSGQRGGLLMADSRIRFSFTMYKARRSSTNLATFDHFYW